MNDLENTLAHYGIKGMKWGVRRSDAQLAKARGDSGGQTRINTDNLSTPELRDLVERMRLNQQYDELLAKTSTANGKTHVQQYMKDAGRQYLKELQKESVKIAAVATLTAVGVKAVNKKK